MDTLGDMFGDLAVNYRDDIFRLPDDLATLAQVEGNSVHISPNLDETSRVERIMFNLTSLETTLGMAGGSNWQKGMQSWISGRTSTWVGPSFEQIFRPFRGIHHVVVLVDVNDDIQERRPLDHLSWDQLECVQEEGEHPARLFEKPLYAYPPWWHGKLAATLEQRGLGH